MPWRSLLVTVIAAVAVLASIGAGWWMSLAPRHDPSVVDDPAEPGTPEAAAPATAAEFAAYLQRHPKDVRAMVLKARLDVQADRFAEAVAGYERALAASPKVARDAGVWVELAEARGLMQGGKLSGLPAELLAKALALDAAHPRALDLAGSGAWERGEFEAAAAHWGRLLAQIPATDPRHAELSAAIEAANRRARFALPAATLPASSAVR